MRYKDITAPKTLKVQVIQKMKEELHPKSKRKPIQVVASVAWILAVLLY